MNLKKIKANFHKFNHRPAGRVTTGHLINRMITAASRTLYLYAAVERGWEGKTAAISGKSWLRPRLCHYTLSNTDAERIVSIKTSEPQQSSEVSNAWFHPA